MANNKIGCSAGKTSLVDPNNFQGQNSATNVSIPLEDLNIYVQLETSKKPRTILESTNEPIGTTISSDKINISFIEGTSVNGQKVLTTQYTDLTTNLNEANGSENLGITSVDIDFNSSYAPMITINFIDVRGSAIYQNEENIISGKNKFATFFQLPYPLFRLTVKGYYGQPVAYCLHMTKYNSRFNTQTGNFEITANFIGYTYAMLSDMLIGYLKAIPYTTLGKARFDRLKAEDNSLMTLDELIVAVSNINPITQKIKASNPDSQKLLDSRSKLENLKNMRGVINVLGQTIDINTELNSYKFIVTEFEKKSPYQPTDESITKYQQDIANEANKYNTDGKFTFDNLTVLTSLKTTNSITINDLLTGTTENITNKLGQLRENNFGSIETTREVLVKLVSDPKYINSVGHNTPLTIYDLNNQLLEISTREKAIIQDADVLKKKLAETMRNEIIGALGFEPTIRNIIKIFTAHVEIFLGVIFDVSNQANANTVRTAELKKKFQTLDKQHLDIPKTEINGVKGLKDNYYPWPEYRKASDETGLIEAYLGEQGVLDNPDNVDELAFISADSKGNIGLLAAFIKSAIVEKDLTTILQEKQTNWCSINPLDTRNFNSVTPYRRINPTTLDDVVNLIVIRGMTYMGFSNKELTEEEIKAIADLEADSIIRDVTDDDLVKALANIPSTTTFTEAKGKINGKITPLLLSSGGDTTITVGGNINTAKWGSQITDSAGKYDYNYIFSGDTNALIKVLPISNSFSGIWSPNNQLLIDKSYETLFLTNYSSTSGSTKPDDGGIYIKILDDKKYRNVKSPILPNTNTDSNVIILSELKKDNIDIRKIGFNQFGGVYNYQEFSQLKYDTDGLDGLPLRFIFYSDTINYGLANGRNSDTNTIFDISESTSKYLAPYSNSDMDSVFNSNQQKDYAKNMPLFKKYLDGKPISLPYLRFGIWQKNFSSDYSLFGSRLYYGQSESTYPNNAKALLFLHSLPWNGLSDGNSLGLFSNNEIINLFSNRAGFINVPTLWAAFVGGLLWRNDETIDPIVFRNSTGDDLIPFNTGLAIPQKNQYLIASEGHGNAMSFGTGNYISLEDILLYLPEQVKTEFKNIFFNFCSGSDSNSINSDWYTIRKNLELIDGSLSDWETAYDNLILTAVPQTIAVPRQTLTNSFNNGNKYIIATPIVRVPSSVTTGIAKYNVFLELKGDSLLNEGMNVVLDAMVHKELYIANTGYKIWQKNTVIPTREGIIVSHKDMDTYLKAIIAKLNKNTPTNKETIETSIFGTKDENLIKFNLYKTLKNIYDKWVGGVEDEDKLIFQCGDRNTLDSELAKKRTGKDTKPLLIDSFRFVDRSFKDIGDDFIINPLPIVDLITANSNTSFYDMVTSLLSSNNFDFIPLPAYIDYNDPKILETMFDTVDINSLDGISGPSFVCVYVGQTSKSLDFGGSNYPNDGIDFKCDGFGGMQPISANDFSQDASPYENKVAVFAVNFSQQNQNIFKDITLDQSEFTETAESLKIIDDISKNGTETNRSFVGQNIFNVYSVRSYKAGVEMMGNAMIQPMMYFQLNNIPMFHGGYMITHVTHSIKPNTMSTNFSGVRIRNIETPFINTTTLYMNMLDSLDVSDNSNSSGSTNTINSASNSTNISVPNTLSIDALKNKLSNKFNIYINKYFNKN